jgi:hypothetical protein
VSNLPSRLRALARTLGVCALEAKKLEAERDLLRAFAQAVMVEWPETYDLDGGDLQDIAVKHGLLKTLEVTEPCGEHCFCAEYHGDFDAPGGVTCYRRTPLLTGNPAAESSPEPRPLTDADRHLRARDLWDAVCEEGDLSVYGYDGDG